MTTKSLSMLQNWYAAPMTTEQALEIKQRTERHIQRNIGRRMRRLPHISLMCARFWLDDFHDYDFELLKHTLTKPRRVRALLYLVYGQLLLATKQNTAFEYLDQGLRLADGLMKSRDYFEVYNRHQLLQNLRLSMNRMTGHTLESLLTEAAVINRIALRSSDEMTFQPARFDTLINKGWN